MAVTVTVNGVSQTTRLRNNSTVRGSSTLGAKSTATFQFKDDTEASGAYRVPLDVPVVFSFGALTLFGGKVQETIDTPLGEPNVGVVTQVSVTDWTTLTDQAFILTEEFAAGQTLKAIVQYLITHYLGPLGVTLDAGMLSGPVMGLIQMNNMTGTDALNMLSTLSGWVWFIDASKVLHMFAVGTLTGTALSGSNTRQLTWKRSRTSYVNDVTLIYGPSGMLNKTQVVVGDGVTTQWLLDYTPALDQFNAILSQGYVADTDYGGNSPLGIYGGGGLWTYDYTTNLLHRSVALPVGDTGTLIYGAQFPQSVNVYNSSEITANGRYARSFSDTNIDDKSAALDAAYAILRKSILTPKSATVVTEAAGPWTPGMSVTMSFSSRLVTGSYLITEVEWETQPDETILYTLQLLEGNESQETWLDFFKNAFGGTSTTPTGVASGGSGSYTPIVPIAGGRSIVFLGGSAVEWVQASSSAWVPASAVRVTLNPSDRGTTVAIVSVRVRANAGSVQARLQNITDNTTAGIGTAITDTNWHNDTFSVVLAAGDKEYELQVLPSLADTDVAAIGNLK